MKISKTAAGIARRVFRMCVENDALNEAKLSQAVSLLAKSQTRDLRGIFQGLKRLVELDVQRRQVTVESAVELDGAGRARVEAGMAKQHGAGLIFSYQVTPELLGGLRIRKGDDVLDGSVKGRLDRLASLL